LHLNFTKFVKNPVFKNIKSFNSKLGDYILILIIIIKKFKIIILKLEKEIKFFDRIIFILFIKFDRIIKMIYIYIIYIIKIFYCYFF